MVKSILVAILSFFLWQDIQGYPSSRNSSFDTAESLGYFSTPYDYIDDVDANRIYGGYFATDGEFPFMAIVHRLMGNGYIAQCGGTIISSRWILTAGHCVATQPRKFLVVVGTTSQAGVGYDTYTGSGISMITTEGALHPQYSKVVNDVGLLHLPQDIPFNANIQPISIATQEDDTTSLVGTTVTVIGWGLDGTQSHTSTQRLKYANLPIISNSVCSSYWAVDDRNICTEAGVGQDACQGDSGGPLALTNTNGQLLQVGIVSYGDKYCPSQRPGVYTRVSVFSSWIKAVMNLNY